MCTTLVEVCGLPIFLMHNHALLFLHFLKPLYDMFYLFDQLGELGRLSASMKKLEKEIKNSNKYGVCCSCLCINSSKFQSLVYFGTAIALP